MPMETSLKGGIDRSCQPWKKIPAKNAESCSDRLPIPYRLRYDETANAFTHGNPA